MTEEGKPESFHLIPLSQLLSSLLVLLHPNHEPAPPAPFFLFACDIQFAQFLAFTFDNPTSLRFH